MATEMPNLAEEPRGLAEEFLKAHQPDSKVLNHVVKCCLLERMHNKEFKRLYLHLCPSLVKIETIFALLSKRISALSSRAGPPKGTLSRGGKRNFSSWASQRLTLMSKSSEQHPRINFFSS